MPKSEVLIEMPEFEKKYNLAMVDTEKSHFTCPSKTIFTYR